LLTFVVRGGLLTASYSLGQETPELARSETGQSGVCSRLLFEAAS